jgi:polyhydroxyalkanoate synthesis regulator phasin
MIDIIKKTLLAGVGAAVITKDKVEAALGDFVKQGKVSSAEAQAMAERIAADGKREFDTLSQELGEKLRDALAGIDPEAKQRLDALEARVTALERAAAAAASQAADKIEPTPGD